MQQGHLQDTYGEHLKIQLQNGDQKGQKYTGRYLELLKDLDFGSDKINAYEFDKPYLFGDRTGRGKS